MIAQQELDAVVGTYEKHGWLLRRVVVKDAEHGVTSNVTITKGVVDAAWFSRPAAAGPIAWEIRFLGATQYALVEHVDENSPGFEDQLREIEQRLADAVAKKGTA